MLITGCQVSHTALHRYTPATPFYNSKDLEYIEKYTA